MCKQKQSASPVSCCCSPIDHVPALWYSTIEPAGELYHPQYARVQEKRLQERYSRGWRKLMYWIGLSLYVIWGGRTKCSISAIYSPSSSIYPHVTGPVEQQVSWYSSMVFGSFNLSLSLQILSLFYIAVIVLVFEWHF